MAALLLVYVLSLGPVMQFTKDARHPYLWPDWVFTVYAPVIWLHDHTFLRKPLNTYVSWWVKELRTP